MTEITCGSEKASIFNGQNNNCLPSSHNPKNDSMSTKTCTFGISSTINLAVNVADLVSHQNRLARSNDPSHHFPLSRALHSTSNNTSINSNINSEPKPLLDANTLNQINMAIAILLELERQSCKGIYALRRKYGIEGGFVIAILRDLYHGTTTLSSLATKLPKISAVQAPFEMDLYGLHRWTSQSGLQSIQFSLGCQELKDLSRDLQQQLGSFKISRALKNGLGREDMPLCKDIVRNPRRYIDARLHVRVGSKIADAAEAARIFEEVRQVDPVTLGRPRAIGLRLEWWRSTESYQEELIPFLGKS